MPFYPASHSDRRAAGVVALINLQLAFSNILVQGTLPGMGTLGKSTGIVGVVGAALAQRRFPSCTVQGDTRMTVSLQRCPAIGTGNCLSVNRLMTTGTRCGSQQTGVG